MLLYLPLAPLDNHYWRHTARNRRITVYVSQEGKDFRETVRQLWIARKYPYLEGRLGIEVDVFPPDNRRRDIANYAKALHDALMMGGLFHDDEQLDLVTYRRQGVFPGGRLKVHLWTL